MQMLTFYNSCRKHCLLTAGIDTLRELISGNYSLHFSVNFLSKRILSTRKDVN